MVVLSLYQLEKMHTGTWFYETQFDTRADCLRLFWITNSYVFSLLVDNVINRKTLQKGLHTWVQQGEVALQPKK
jgi:hypothetical protein